MIIDNDQLSCNLQDKHISVVYLPVGTMTICPLLVCFLQGHICRLNNPMPPSGMHWGYNTNLWLWISVTKDVFCAKCTFFMILLSSVFKFPAVDCWSDHWSLVWLSSVVQQTNSMWMSQMWPMCRFVFYVIFHMITLFIGWGIKPQTVQYNPFIGPKFDSLVWLPVSDQLNP